MNAAEFQKKVLENPKPVVIDLWAPWCGPCRAMEPAFKKIGQKYAGDVEVIKINVDESPQVAKSLGVMSIPTVIGYSGGKQILRRTGVQSMEALNIIFESTLHQRQPDILPPAPIDRLLRSFAGLALLALGWFVSGHSLLLMALGAVVLFSAFYDRCPIYRAIVPRVKALFRRPG